MLHSLNTSGNLAGSSSLDMTVLERQRARKKWQQEQQERQGFFGNFNDVLCDSALGEVVAQYSMKPGPGLENGSGWPELGKFEIGIGPSGFGFDVNSAISRNFSFPEEAKGRDSVSAAEKTNLTRGKESFKKRKADKAQNQNSKVVAEKDNNEKRIKVSASDEGESKITEQTSDKNTKTNSNRNNRETSADNSKENSKVSEARNQKPDYIHVRARRGQATDSHSLAERVRREKISERMKYLQDLVPGCNKITGKAGMLDEIINYVQSLQRQVEFLSMKLSVVNPRLDFSVDDLFAKEVFPACSACFPTMGMSMSSDITNPAYLPFNSAQQLVSCCGLVNTNNNNNNNMGISPSDMELRRTISAPVLLPETFIDSSCFTQILPSSTWESDFQNLYNVAFDQARPTTSFPLQPFTGLVETSNLKLEM